MQDTWFSRAGAVLRPYIKYAVLAVLVYYPVFGFLDMLPIRIWDESRLAANAFEMYFNHDYIVTRYGGLPDLWSTKPPLMIWLQVLCMHFVGFNEIAVRLPSAISTFVICIAFMVISQRYLKSF